MSKQVLYVKSSVFGDGGVSSQLSDALLARLEQELGAVEVVTRDLNGDPLPHLSAGFYEALSTDEAERTAAQSDLVKMADTVIDEVQAADILVVTAPMYNFNVPSTLKAWIDYLARAGVTFRYTEQGVEGLLKDKKVYVVTTRGGLHKGAQSDIETPYLSLFFNFVGLTDIEFIYAEGLNMGAKEEAMELAMQSINQLRVA